MKVLVIVYLLFQLCSADIHLLPTLRVLITASSTIPVTKTAEATQYSIAEVYDSIASIALTSCIAVDILSNPVAEPKNTEIHTSTPKARCILPAFFSHG
jgi:hypothetical protein